MKGRKAAPVSVEEYWPRAIGLELSASSYRPAFCGQPDPDIAVPLSGVFE
jgi:hypothetical protein